MAGSRTSSATELLVELRRDDSLPLYRQLEQELREGVRSGRLAARSVLPSTRTLARQLGLSRGVVVEAYEQLVAEGYLASHAGGTTRVGDRAAEPEPLARLRAAAAAPEIDFAYGRPDVTQFPRQVWLRSLRRVLNDAPSARLSYLDGRGVPELHDALATYMNRVRATDASPDRIVICNGFAQALGLVMEVLAATGRKRVGAEDPGQTDTADTARRHGLEIVPIPVDEDGLVVEGLDRAGVDAVALTPAHHFPTGAVMSAERRSAVVGWARRRGGMIIEDDYDAEYRYDREPIGAIQGLAPEHVIYAGSASKTLAPGLRLGWLVAPTALVEPIAAAKEATDRGSASLEQLAFADFLARGEFDRHLRRMRPIYARRRMALLRALARFASTLRPTGASAGLHVLAWIPDSIDEAAVLDAALALGVGVRGVRRYASDRWDGPGGLLFGYATLMEAEIEKGVRLIGQALDGVSGRAAGAPRMATGRGPERIV